MDGVYTLDIYNITQLIILYIVCIWYPTSYASIPNSGSETLNVIVPLDASWIEDKFNNKFDLSNDSRREFPKCPKLGQTSSTSGTSFTYRFPLH